LYRCKVLLALFVLVSLLPGMAMANVQDAGLWENDAWRLTLDESNLIFTLESKASGNTVESALSAPDKSLNKQWKDFLGSTVVIEYALEDSSTTTRLGLINSEATWTVSAVEDGFDADICFNTVGISLRLSVRLTDDGLTMTVPAESIVETNENLLCAVHMAPAWGATLLDEKEGYLFIPEAAGAIIRYSDGNISSKSPYTKAVWGDDLGVDEPSASRAMYPSVKAEEKILLPVYGNVNTTDGLASLFILEQGQENAEIIAYAAGIVTNYNFVGARYVMRDKYFKLNSATRGSLIFQKDIQSRDLITRVCLLEGEQATYSGMAQRYRAYLLQEMQLQAIEDTRTVRVDFLAGETRKGIFFDETVAVTTIDQMADILQKFADAGLTNVDAYYVGWQQGGKTSGYGVKPTGIDGALGSKQELYNLGKMQEERGGTLSLTQDLLHAYPKRTYRSGMLARMINKEIMKVFTNHIAYPELNILSPLVVPEYAQALKKLADGQLDLSITGISGSMFSYAANNKDLYSRQECFEQYSSIFSDLTQDHRLAMDQPLSCYLPYTDAYLDMPLETTNYTLIEAGVPFLPMVIDGLIPYWSDYLNFSADPDYTLLKLIEYNANPSYIITAVDAYVLQDTNSNDIFSAQWDVFLPDILKVRDALAQLNVAVEGSNMCDHRIEGDVVYVTYSNGASVCINYGISAAETDDGQILAPGSYCIRGGEKE